MSRYLVSDFSRAARAYDNYAGFQNVVVKRLVARAKQQCESFGNILDIGAGTGSIAKELNVPREQIMQVDISQEMCDVAAAYGQTTVTNAEKLPFDDAFYNSVFSSMMMQWVDLPGSVSNEVARVLKKDGYYFMALPVLGSFVELEGALRMAGRKQSIRSFAHSDDVEMYIKNAGLTILESEVEASIEEFSSVKKMLNSIRRIGASNKNDSRGSPFTKEQWRGFTSYYENGVTITWNILYIIAQKQ